MKKKSIFYISLLYLYLIRRRLLRRLRRLRIASWRVYLRLARRLYSSYSRFASYFFATRFRLLRRLRYRYFRLLIFFIWRLWLEKVDGFENIPEHESAIVVSNHLSFFDFWILSAVLKKQTYFVAVKNLDKRPIVGWTMRLNPIIYVDREKPGGTFLKQAMRQLIEQSRLLVIYPEGTRSRTGKMLPPKSGFVKLAIKTGVPIIPVSMKGTYEILPPHKHLPRLKKCTVHIGKKIYISPHNAEFYDIFYRKQGEERRFKNLDDSELDEIAYRIMDKVRRAAGEEWDESMARKSLRVPPEILLQKEILLKDTSH